MFGREREQGQMTGPLDGYGKATLVLVTCSGLASTPDLAAVCHKATESGHILVVYSTGLFETEGTHLPAGCIATTSVAPAAAPTTGAA